MITSYTTLQTKIADWLARADLTANIPVFIQLGHSRIFRKLRVAQMQAEAAGTTSPALRFINVPERCVEIQSVYVNVNGRPVPLRPLSPEMLSVRNEETAYPVGYVRVGDNLRLIGGQAVEYEYGLFYFESPAELSDENETNWLVLSEPSLYLYSALIEAEPFLQNDARIVVWKSLFDDAMKGIQSADDSARYGHSLQMPKIGYYA